MSGFNFSALAVRERAVTLFLLALYAPWFRVARPGEETAPAGTRR